MVARIRVVLGLLVLSACSAPHGSLRAQRIGLARGKWELVAFGGMERSVGEPQWSGPGRIVTSIDDSLWFFDVAQPDRAQRLRIGKSPSFASDPHTDVLAVTTVELDAGAKISIVRGTGIVRTLPASDEPGTRYDPATVAPDGRTVVLRSNHPYDSEGLRFVDVDTGVVHGAVAGELAIFDSSGAFVIAGDTIYTRDLHELYAVPKHGNRGEPGWSRAGWIGTTAFSFSATGADAFDAKAGRTGVLPMPCKAPGIPEDRIDAEHGRVIRICDDQVYIASWPGAVVQQLALPDTHRELYEPVVNAGDPASSFLAMPRMLKSRAPIFRIDPPAGTVVLERLSDPDAPECAIQLDIGRPFAWCAAQVDASGTYAATVDAYALVVADLKRRQEVARYGYATSDSMEPKNGTAELVDGALEVRHGERVAYRFPTPPPGRVATGSILFTGTLLKYLDPAGTVLGEHTVDESCRHALLTDTGVVLLCDRNEGSEAINLSLPALEPAWQRTLPKLFVPQRLERYGADVLATGARGQAILGTDAAAAVGELLLWGDTGVVRDPRGNVLLAGRREALERTLWCASQAFGAFTEARSFSRCHAAFEAQGVTSTNSLGVAR